MAHTTLEIAPRPAAGSPAARKLRRTGLIPGILYGHGRDPLPFAVEVPKLREALAGQGGRNAVLYLRIEGEAAETAALLKDYQLDPVRDRLTHVDLLAISLTEKITAPVTVTLVGEPAGVREGGVLDQTTMEVEVETLPTALPSEIEVDVSGLGITDSIKASDLVAPAGVQIVSDPDLVIATIILPTTMDDIEAEQAEDGDVEDAPAGADE